MDLEGPEDRKDCVGEGQQQSNIPTDRSNRKKKVSSDLLILCTN
jgi:hypothetical protein